MSQNFPANSNVSYLALSSQDDPNVISPTFNPADFTVTVPNSTRLQEVVRIAITSCSIPRMFQNVSGRNNVLIFWQRQVVEIDYSSVLGPGWVLRTVDPTWRPLSSVRLTTGIRNMADILAMINAQRTAVAAPDVWTYVPYGPPFTSGGGGNVQINTTVTGVPWVFGPFYMPGWVNPGVLGASNQTIVTSFDGTSGSDPFPGLGAMALLGLRALSEEAKTTELINSQLFSAVDPNTFGSVNGMFVPGDIFAKAPYFEAGVYPNQILKLARLPLYDQLAGYSTWSTTNYQTPALAPPDLSGPSTVYVTMSDIGDGTTTYAKTGTNYDVITAVNISDTPWGENGFKDVKDGEFEGIGLRQPRNITAMRVRCLDEQFNQLVLPPNFAVDLRAQLVFVTR